MKYKNISTQSNELLLYLRESNRNWFGLDIAKEALKYSTDTAIKKLLSDMVKRGLLMRLKRGIYYVIPYEEHPDCYIPDWHLLAEPLVEGVDYYIGYYSAMEIHNLITQPSLKEQIVTSKQIKPSILDINRIKFQFVYHKREHFFGYKEIWIDSYNKVHCSDLEKTIIDALFKPEYSGGIVEIAKALYISKDKLNFKRLLEYAERFKSQAIIKRLGFLLELLDIGNCITEILREQISSSYSVLDTELPSQGKFISRWRIQQNIDIETIKSAIYT